MNKDEIVAALNSYGGSCEDDYRCRAAKLIEEQAKVIEAMTAALMRMRHEEQIRRRFVRRPRYPNEARCILVSILCGNEIVVSR